MGASLAAWRKQQIDAVVAVGPLECMPTKIAEAQFHQLAEHEGLLSLTLAYNGDPVSTAVIDNLELLEHMHDLTKVIVDQMIDKHTIANDAVGLVPQRVGRAT